MPKPLCFPHLLFVLNDGEKLIENKSHIQISGLTMSYIQKRTRNIRNYKIMSREAARLPVHGGCLRQRQGNAPAQHPGSTTASTAQQGMRMPEKSGKFFSIYPCQSHCYFASPDRDSRIGEEAVLQCTVTVLEKCSGCSAL